MKIHIHSRQGMYTVANYGTESITVVTKHGMRQVPSSDFKSFAGGNWNDHVTKEQMDAFLFVVQPNIFQKQIDQEKAIISMARAIDNQEEQHEAELSAATYKKWYDEEKAKSSKMSEQMLKIARQVYSQDLDFSKLQFIEKGIKFIIQTDINEDYYRFCWDPYGFMNNYHSNISEIYRNNDWYTKNGGWLKIIDDNVILYSKSGDYGVYDDAVAIKAASKIFKGKKIHSFAGKDWDEQLENMFFELPF